MNLHSTRQLLAGAAVSTVLAFVAACSGPSSSAMPTGPSALASSSASAGANFSPNPACEAGQWFDNTVSSICRLCTDVPQPSEPFYEAKLLLFEAQCEQVPPPTGEDGCTPGYWKGNYKKGGSSWSAAGLAPTDTVGSLFAAGSFNSTTLIAALEFGGGPGVEGATQNLLRAAVAAALNANNPNVAYALTLAQIQSLVNGAIAGGNRDTILSAAATLDGYNNAGCTLDNND